MRCGTMEDCQVQGQSETGKRKLNLLFDRKNKQVFRFNIVFLNNFIKGLIGYRLISKLGPDIRRCMIAR